MKFKKVLMSLALATGLVAGNAPAMAEELSVGTFGLAKRLPSALMVR